MQRFPLEAEESPTSALDPDQDPGMRVLTAAATLDAYGDALAYVVPLGVYA